MTAPLAEVVEEGRRLVTIHTVTANTMDAGRIAVFMEKHGPRLLAVAEAALEMRRVYDYAIPILIEGPGGTAVEIEADTMISEADAAFDAAARGEK